MESGVFELGGYDFKVDKNSYQNLIVFQKALDLVVVAYEVARKLPDIEKYGLASQIRRAAEGHGRRSNGDFERFLTISLGSCRELETLFMICKRLNYEVEADTTIEICNEVARMLNALHRKIRDVG